MSVIYFLIGVGILVAGGFLVFFIWAVKSGQYEDVYSPSIRILFDDYKSDNQKTNSSLPDQENDKNNIDKSEKSDNNKT